MESPPQVLRQVEPSVTSYKSTFSAISKDNHRFLVAPYHHYINYAPYNSLSNNGVL